MVKQCHRHKNEKGGTGQISNPAVAKMMAKMGYKDGQGIRWQEMYLLKLATQKNLHFLV